MFGILSDRNVHTPLVENGGRDDLTGPLRGGILDRLTVLHLVFLGHAIESPSLLEDIELVLTLHRLGEKRIALPIAGAEKDQVLATDGTRGG